MSVAGEGHSPGRPHLLKLAEEVDVRKPDAHEIIEQIRAALSGFEKLSRKLKLTKNTTKT